MLTVTKFLLAQVPFLDGLVLEEAQELAAKAQQLSFAAGQTVLFRGTTVEGLYVVAAGKVSVWVRPDKGGKTPVQVAELGPGDVFGETAVFSNKPRTASVKAITDVRLLVVTREILSNAVGLTSWMGGFVKALATRFLELDGRLRSSPHPPTSSTAEAGNSGRPSEESR